MAPKTPCGRASCQHSMSLHVQRADGAGGMEWACLVQGCQCDDYVVANADAPLRASTKRLRLVDDVPIARRRDD